MMLTQIHCCYFFITLFYIDQILFVYGKTVNSFVGVYSIYSEYFIERYFLHVAFLLYMHVHV